MKKLHIGPEMVLGYFIFLIPMNTWPLDVRKVAAIINHSANRVEKLDNFSYITVVSPMFF